MTTLVINAMDHAFEIKLPPDQAYGQFDVDVNATGQYVKYTWEIKNDALHIRRDDFVMQASIVNAAIALLQSLPHNGRAMVSKAIDELLGTAIFTDIVAHEIRILRGGSTLAIGIMWMWG